MRRKLTITLAEDVYQRLHRQVGRGQISSFIEELVRPLVAADSEEAAYREMAADAEREREALEWIEAAPGESHEAMADQIRTVAK
jgi:predicted CopG family antitoxin